VSPSSLPPRPRSNGGWRMVCSVIQGLRKQGLSGAMEGPLSEAVLPPPSLVIAGYSLCLSPTHSVGRFPVEALGSVSLRLLLRTSVGKFPRSPTPRVHASLSVVTQGSIKQLFLFKHLTE
jgi:hypothetical protein